MNKKSIFNNLSRMLIAFSLLFIALSAPLPAHAANRTDIVGPAGSGRFGENVTVLANGNFVVTDSQYSPGGAPAQIGAAYLYDGETFFLISTLTGSQAYDQVGEGGVYALSNGNFVVQSPSWQNGTIPAAGAVTWCSGIVGCNGEVSAANSLVGSQAGDLVGSSSLTPLSDGDYVVFSPMWINGSIDSAGAVTWCSGVTGCQGPVSESNSMVGTESGQFGRSILYVFALPNGSFVVRSPDWNNGTLSNAGAVRWCSGTSPCIGPMTESNSLAGTHDQDLIGFGGGYGELFILPNGSYMVASPEWDDGPVSDVGAVTWCSGITGCTGPVTPFNSVVGSVAGDWVGWYGIKILTNDNYVVWNTSLHNGALIYAGGVRLCSGAGGCAGAMTPANSLVGTHDYDGVGLVVPLTNGNYVVRSARWDGPAIPNVGAVTWCSGTSGCTGPVTEVNSLVGSHSDDDPSDGGPYALTNGNYVVLYPNWDNGSIVNAGAARWCSGLGGCTGPITAANGLVGTTPSEGVGSPSMVKLTNGNYIIHSHGVIWCSGTSGCIGPASSVPKLNSPGFAIALSDGNYVVSNTGWSNGTSNGAGLVHWCNGNVGCTGSVSAADSLVGSTTSDQVGDQITALSNGKYVVYSQYWDNGAITDAGAVTMCLGGGVCTGTVSPDNSLVGSQADDQVGSGNVYALPAGGFLIFSPLWDHGAVMDSGAITWVESSSATIVGPITDTNSVVGDTANTGMYMGAVYDAAHFKLLIKRPFDNKVTVLALSVEKIFLPLLRR